jgi:hypothetical protein
VAVYEERVDVPIERDEMLVATCHETEMATQGENLDELLVVIRDLVRCRFEEGRSPKVIRLHFVRKEVLGC